MEDLFEGRRFVMYDKPPYEEKKRRVLQSIAIP